MLPRRSKTTASAVVPFRRATFTRSISFWKEPLRHTTSAPTPRLMRRRLACICVCSRCSKSPIVMIAHAARARKSDVAYATVKRRCKLHVLDNDRLAETVSDAANRRDDVVFASGAQLSAQAADVDFDEVGRRIAIAFPERVFERLTADERVRSAQEVFEKRGLSSRERNLAIAATYAS